MVKLPGTSEHWWDALLQQGQIKLDANKTYRLTFEASASSPKSMQAVLSQNAGDFVKYFEEEVELTADQKVVYLHLHYGGYLRFGSYACIWIRISAIYR